jgi:gamma-glutamyl-gamma-aminobutyraldehyde dehydrogenase
MGALVGEDQLARVLGHVAAGRAEGARLRTGGGRWGEAGTYLRPTVFDRVDPSMRLTVNCYEEGDLTVPFGGVKQSGHGRDKSAQALDKYLDLKTTWIQL